jgi:N-acetylglutamate synthase-like GNAT family acetyltransferase
MDETQFIVKELASQEDAQKSYCCMMEVPSPWPEALCVCRNWIAQNLGETIQGYHLELADGQVVGHLYYALSECALFAYQVEPQVGILYCEWVQRKYQGQGLGTRLFDAFLGDMRAQNIKGLLVDATDLEGQMHYSHYSSRGFSAIFQSGHRKLLYLPLSQPDVLAQPLTPRLEPRRGAPVEIVLLNGYLCPFEISAHLLMRQVAQEFGSQVNLREVTLTRETLQDYGAAYGVFINGRQKLFGGESEAAIRQAIREEL